MDPKKCLWILWETRVLTSSGSPSLASWTQDRVAKLDAKVIMNDATSSRVRQGKRGISITIMTESLRGSNPQVGEGARVSTFPSVRGHHPWGKWENRKMNWQHSIGLRGLSIFHSWPTGALIPGIQETVDECGYLGSKFQKAQGLCYGKGDFELRLKFDLGDYNAPLLDIYHEQLAQDPWLGNMT